MHQTCVQIAVSSECGFESWPGSWCLKWLSGKLWSSKHLKTLSLEQQFCIVNTDRAFDNVEYHRVARLRSRPRPSTQSGLKTGIETDTNLKTYIKTDGTCCLLLSYTGDHSNHSTLGTGGWHFSSCQTISIRKLSLYQTPPEGKQNQKWLLTLRKLNYYESLLLHVETSLNQLI